MNKNAVAAIRVSTTKQGTDGDSPDAQKEQIERFAKDRGITIKKFFVFLESASKEQQPIQEAIDYCKNDNNKIDLFIIKSIDRFTRGGSDMYNPLKKQLDELDVSLVDIYGVISDRKVNTLDHLGVEYKWSVYSPSKKSEILEAERSKDELRDIMSRMIGAEVRYTRMGYWMRRPPYGFMSEKIDTQHGKRTMLKPDPEESKFIIKMFELRASGKYTDREIATKINNMGYATRTRYRYSKTNPGQVIKKTGGNPLNERHLWRLVRTPTYAGVNTEKWTDGKPVRFAFDGLVSVNLFNRANLGKRTILEKPDGSIAVVDKAPPKHLTEKGRRNADFPYKKYILCPECEKPLLGSASRGKMGKYYPAYHCTKRGHYFRVSKQDLETVVDSFMTGIEISPARMDDVFRAIEVCWEKSQAQHEAMLLNIDQQIEDVQGEITVTVQKLKVLSSDTAIKFMEADLIKLEKKLEALEQEKSQKESKKPVDIGTLLTRAKYMVEHFEELVVKQMNPIKKAHFFGAIFDTPPSFERIKGGTQKTPLLTGVSPIFRLKADEISHLVISRRIELLLPG